MSTARTAVCDSTGIRLMDGGEQVAMIIYSNLWKSGFMSDVINNWIDKGIMPREEGGAE